MGILILNIGFQAKVRAQETQESLALDVGVTYTAERAKIVSAPCDCFWLHGGSADAAVTIYRGLGAAISMSGQHSSNIAPGVDLNKLSLMAGPRYTYGVSRWTNRFFGEKRATSVFGEALFGYAHGFNSLFPSGTGVQTSASAFSVQIGGGINVNLAKGFGLRALQLDYVRTTLPNSVSDTQNDFRLAVGVTYRVHLR